MTTDYDAEGNANLFTSYNNSTGGASNIVNQVLDVYNGLGQLTAEYQEQAGAVNTSTSAEVQYAYTEMAGGQNNSRLTSMTYPNGRVLDFVYNSGLDSNISRLSAIADDNAGSPGTVLESYAYLGLGIIVAWSHPQTGVNLTYIRQASQTSGCIQRGHGCIQRGHANRVRHRACSGRSIVNAHRFDRKRRRFLRCCRSPRAIIAGSGTVRRAALTAAQIRQRGGGLIDYAFFFAASTASRLARWAVTSSRLAIPRK